MKERPVLFRILAVYSSQLWRIPVDERVNRSLCGGSVERREQIERAKRAIEDGFGELQGVRRMTYEDWKRFVVSYNIGQGYQTE
jgi:hypothetical protein